MPSVRRAFLLALLFAGLGCWWVVGASLVHSGVQVGGSVPPIPAVTVLALLSLLNPVLQQLDNRWGLSRAEILLVYCFLTIAVSVPDVNVLAYLFAFITAPFYFQSPENNFERFLSHFPDWYALRDKEVIRAFYEGDKWGRVPWEAWVPCLFWWGTLFFALSITSFTLLCLFRRRWVKQERLTFPIVQFVMGFTSETGKIPSFLTSPTMWVGFSLSAVYNLLNMANAFNPAFPALRRWFDLGALFTERPWISLSPLWISIRPEIFGIGYLMPTDALFTAWLGYLLLRLSSVIRDAMGYQVVSTAYDYQEIATGAYIAVMAGMVWRGRTYFKGMIRQGLRGRAETSLNPDLHDPLSPRAALTVAMLGVAYWLWWTGRAGLIWWVSLLHLMLLLCFALVYSRIRAETGTPLIYLFPFWQQQRALLNFFGSAALAYPNPRSLTILASLGFLSRGVFPELASYHIESMEIAHRAAIQSRHVTLAVLGAIPFGFLIGGWLYLVNGYRYGFNFLDAGQGSGGYRVYLALQQYRELVQWHQQPLPPNPSYIFQTLLGMALIFGMVALRPTFPGFPLHPLGFAIASAYGFHLWAPFLVVWMLKLFILRLGGALLYRRLVPFALGVVFGHYWGAGILWGLVSVLYPDVARRYAVHFG